MTALKQQPHQDLRVVVHPGQVKHKHVGRLRLLLLRLLLLLLLSLLCAKGLLVCCVCWLLGRRSGTAAAAACGVILRGLRVPLLGVVRVLLAMLLMLLLRLLLLVVHVVELLVAKDIQRRLPSKAQQLAPPLCGGCLGCS